MLTLLPRLLRPSREGALCLHHLERAPSAFVSDASSVSRALLVFCVNQGISASLSLLLSYRQLQTTRFQSIKGPQQHGTHRPYLIEVTELWPCFIKGPRVTFVAIPTGSVQRSGCNLFGGVGFLSASLLS